MAFVVKYIGNCAKNSVDIRPLLTEDLQTGNKILLVCEKQYGARYYGDDITVIGSVQDVQGAKTSVMLLLTEKDARLLAVDCATVLKAAECQVYIRYDGIYTADPAVTPYAARLEKIDYDEVIELCTSGYTGVDMQMVESAKKQGVQLNVRSFEQPQGNGTVIKEVMALGTATVKGIIKEPDICIVSLRDIPDKPGSSYFIFQAVSDAGVNVDMISLPASDYGQQDISFTIHKEDKLTVEKVLKEKQAELGFSHISIKDNVAKISVVGSGVKTSKGVAATVFRLLYENNINLRLISTSEIKIAVFVDKLSADLAVEKIHQYFIK